MDVAVDAVRRAVRSGLGQPGAERLGAGRREDIAEVLAEHDRCLVQAPQPPVVAQAVPEHPPDRDVDVGLLLGAPTRLPNLGRVVGAQRLQHRIPEHGGAGGERGQPPGPVGPEGGEPEDPDGLAAGRQLAGVGPRERALVQVPGRHAVAGMLEHGHP